MSLGHMADCLIRDATQEGVVGVVLHPQVQSNGVQIRQKERFTSSIACIFIKSAIATAALQHAESLYDLVHDERRSSSPDLEQVPAAWAGLYGTRMRMM